MVSEASPLTFRIQLLKILKTICMIWVLASAGWLVATQFYKQFAIGFYVPFSDAGLDWVQFLFLLGLSVLVFVIVLVVRYIVTEKTTLSASDLMDGLILVVLLFSIAGIFILPDIATIHIVWFILLAGLIGFGVLLFPREVRQQGSVWNYLQQLHKQFPLFRIMLRATLYHKYRETFFGFFWIILIPITNVIVMSFVFSQLRDRSVADDIPWVSFYFAAFVPWSFFSSGIQTGVNSLVNKLRLMQQSYFAREILLLVQLGESLIDMFFGFIVMIILNLLIGFYPNVRYIYLLPLTFIMMLVVLGITLFLSYISVRIRDIPQLTGVITRLLFFLTPIIFPMEIFPHNYRFLLFFNPFTAITQGFRSVVLYNEAPNFISLIYPTVLGLVLVYTGYLFFKANERNLVDYI